MTGGWKRQRGREQGRKEIGKEIFCLLVHFVNACNSWDCIRLKPGARNSTWISQLCDRDPSAWGILCCTPGHAWKETLRGLSLYLGCWHSIRVPLWVQLLIWLLANAPGKAVEDSQVLGPRHLCGRPGKDFRLLASAWTSSGDCNLVGQWIRFSFSLSVSSSHSVILPFK